MSKLSRKEQVGIVALLVLFMAGLGWTLLRTARAASTPGVSLQETFTQPPGAPPPGRPSVPSTLPADTSHTANVGHGAASNVTSSPADSASGPALSSASALPSVASPGSAAPAGDIVVHVAGAVHKPGVYHLPIGARNDDALKLAGGPTADANPDGVNLAARLEDGTQLYVPTRKQHPEGGADAPALGPTTSSAPLSASAAHAKAGSSSAKGVSKAAGKDKGGKPGKLSDPSQGTVNINTASAEELQRLPGIGPAMAERIVEYRKQSGAFQTAEDMLQISGIGEKKFAKMQPFIKVH